MKHRAFLLGTFAAAALIAACTSMPQHSNTLVFGTNTKFALDVSQDPTGVMGVTLGYKRQEAVWMPLLANVSAASGIHPPPECGTTTTVAGTTTEKSGCKFTGRAGNDSLNGAGAEDTYSVLATFSGESNGLGNANAPSTSTAQGTDTPKVGSVEAKGRLAQFFATGLAARILAGQGSSIVNTAGGSTQPQAARPLTALAEDVDLQHQRVERIMNKVTDSADTLIVAEFKDLLNKADAQGLSARYHARLTDFKTSADVRAFLRAHYPDAAEPLFKAL